MEESQGVPQSKLFQTSVEQAVVFFIHCFRVPESAAQIAENLSAVGYEAPDRINPKPPKEIYFEKEVYRLFSAGIFTPTQPLKAKTVEHELVVEVTPVIYVLSAQVLLIAIRIEFATKGGSRLDQVMRFVEAFRVCKLRQFHGLQEKPRLLTVELTEESRRLEFDDRNQVTWGFDLVTRAFKLATGREPTDDDIVFGNFAKLFVSLFYNVGSELTPEDRFHIINIDRPANPENPHDWKDPLPAKELVSQCLLENTYPRWEEQKQSFAFMPFAFTMFLEPFDDDRPAVDKFARDFEFRYHVIYIVLLTELTFLQDINSRLARLEVKKLSSKDLANEVASLRRELLKFSNSIWSSRISYEIQPSELFDLGKRVLGLEKLYSEVHDKLSEYDQYLQAKTQERLNSGLWLLQYLFLPFSLAAFLVNFVLCLLSEII